MKKLIFISILTVFVLVSCKNEQKVNVPNENIAVNEAKTEEVKFRPNYHFTPQENWMNDPNGMFFLNDTYHLFYQHYPDGNKWGPMHWGHATSKDLIKWEHLPIALYPDELGYIFSGSAVVDHSNTSGFGNGTTPPVVAIYTNHSMEKEHNGDIDYETQSIAYSLDEGNTWQKYEANPVIENPGIKDFRDPKVFWDNDREQWVLVLAAVDIVKIYGSKNLKDWQFLSDFGKGIGAHGGVWECPELLPMTVQGSNETKWVLLLSINPGGPNGGSATQYFVGDFDGKTFALDEKFKQQLGKDEALWIDYGMDNYAGVTWNNTKESSPVLIGWMSNWWYAQDVPTHKWRSAMTIPRELKLSEDVNGYNLSSIPVKQLESYYKAEIVKENISFGKKKEILNSKTSDLSNSVIDLELKDLESAIYTFTLSNLKGDELKFGIDNLDNVLFLDRRKSGLVNFSDKFGKTVSKAPLGKAYQNAKLKILLDKTSIEIFFNNGERVMTEIFFTNKPFQSFTVESTSGEAKVSLEANEINK